ncbi:hypothetical protein EV421DRAFT_150105 [Armillaria borealis]|uniref:Secreted protein n=1 Tax=Armillaria borealis TaxID=47425 RepID=A0AA39JW12_9AGAR|nr:hypothetical protein EV421DRAFT_150105 [Armillaria borealis]
MCVGPIFVWVALIFIRPFWQTHACTSMRRNVQMALFLTGEAPYIRRSTMKRVLDTASAPLYSRYEVVGLYVTGLRFPTRRTLPTSKVHNKQRTVSLVLSYRSSRSIIVSGSRAEAFVFRNSSISGSSFYTRHPVQQATA